MQTIIISDVHIGSRYFLRDLFMHFLETLPSQATLVLNGDTVDRWSRHIDEPAHQQALERLRQESLVRRIIWIRGNHDEKYELAGEHHVEFVPSHSIDNRLFIAHGYCFDKCSRLCRPLVLLFRLAHLLELQLGAKPVHIARFAKRFSVLYGMLRTHIAKNAVRFARENHYAAVTCGHTHYAEDILMDGIRYINTGSWTEEPVFGLWVTDTDMKLERIGHA